MLPLRSVELRTDHEARVRVWLWAREDREHEVAVRGSGGELRKPRMVTRVAGTDSSGCSNCCLERRADAARVLVESRCSVVENDSGSDGLCVLTMQNDEDLLGQV